MHPQSAPQSATLEHLVIIGNGMAGHRLVEALAKRPALSLRITVIGEEPQPAYNRILLSPLLAGEMERDALTLRDAGWYAEQRIDLVLGERVTNIDRQSRRLTTDAGRTLDYDRLVLATGSRPAMPPIPGLTLAGVHVFRDLNDAEALTRAAQAGGSAVVIGGGLLGLEAAEGLRKQGQAKRGMNVSLIQRDDRLMNRQLDITAARLLEAELCSRGLDIHTDAGLDHLTGDDQGHVTGAMLSDGHWLPAECVVVAIGITPNKELGQVAGLEVNRAIVVDETLTTSEPAIHALGECCEFQGNTFGLVEPIWKQVEVLAAHLAGEPTAGYVETPCATKLKVSGVSLYAFGPTEAEPDHDVLTYRDPLQGDYRRLLLCDGHIVGAVLYGDTAMGPWYFEHSLAGTDLGPCRQALLLGAADADALLHEHANPDSPERPVKEAA